MLRHSWAHDPSEDFFCSFEQSRSPPRSLSLLGWSVGSVRMRDGALMFATSTNQSKHKPRVLAGFGKSLRPFVAVLCCAVLYCAVLYRTYLG